MRQLVAFVRRKPGTMVGRLAILALLVWSHVTTAWGELPAPVLQTVFPAGAQAGTVFDVTVDGANLDELLALRFSHPRITATHKDGKTFRVTIPSEVAPEIVDVRVVTRLGISGPRRFLVGALPTIQEVEPNDTAAAAHEIAVDRHVEGRSGQPGDVDWFRFSARAGQRIVAELWAYRIDSSARMVLELYDAAGRRLAVNRGHWGVDPQLHYTVPADGTYLLKLFEQTLAGGSDRIYHLELDTRPRVEQVFPPIVESRSPTQVTLFGHNVIRTALVSNESVSDERRVDPLLSAVATGRLQQASVEIPPRDQKSPSETVIYQHPDAVHPVMLPVADYRLTTDREDNHQLASAQALDVPCDVAGRLWEGDEQDWYAVTLRRGEVVWLEAFGERLGAPVDLDLAVFNAAREELVHWTDTLDNLGGNRFPTQHSDPAGRFVAPDDGTFFVLVRNVTGNATTDPRRVYRLTVCREEPDFRLTLLPRRADQPTGVSVLPGGREVVDLLVERRRGFAGPLRVVAEDLPSGVSCLESWIGPQLSIGQLVFTVDRTALPGITPLHVVGIADVGGRTVRHTARHATMVRAGRPTGWGRWCDETTLAIASGLPRNLLTKNAASQSGANGAASSTIFPLRVTASLAETQLFQDSVVDIAIDLEREASVAGPVRISVIGLPEEIEIPAVTIPAGESHGWVSVTLPASLAAGPYSITLKAEADIRVGEAARPTSVAATTFSNPLTLQVQVGRIHVVVDPSTPKKIARGQVIHIKYQAQRRGGFIGKIHTELAAPGGVEGVRGRGVTFTGQTETGEIQVIATETAPLGPVKFLRLDAVGTVEDRPTYRGGRLVELEITE